MFTAFTLFLVLLAYLLLLFAVAYYAERKELAGRSVANSPYVYALSLAVYCTSWTFYGSVGRAATSGLSFLTIYLGPTLMAALWMVLLRKMVRVAKANRITTISDFIGFRYGRSLSLSALVAFVAIVGTIPYLGLQIKAIITTFNILSHGGRGGPAVGLIITAILGGFAIMFGARRLDSSERHGGLVYAIAFESIVKLVAFLAVGIFVTWGIFDGFGDIFARIRAADGERLLALGAGSATSHAEWTALLVLSMLAIILLPRQFQMAVVENYEEAHIAKAAWLFPLYLFLINLFVLPIAFGGLLAGGSALGADYFVLTLPLDHDRQGIALLAFIGGFSAATGMVIVEALALSTMAMNSILLPALIRYPEHPRIPRLILNLKRAVILAIVYLGYSFAVSIGEVYSLVDIGLKSFEAVALFAPAFLLGLFWKRGTKAGAIAGLSCGFLVWFYTLIVPALLKAGIVTFSGPLTEILASSLWNPHGLFGVTALGKWGNSLFWGMVLNVGVYVGVSLATRPSRAEELQALRFVEEPSAMVRELARGSSYTTGDIEGILAQYVGPAEARAVVGGFLARKGLERRAPTSRELLELREEAERVLSGAVGSSLSAIIFEDKLVLTEQERAELSASLQLVTESLRLSRQELAETNLALSYLKEFSANIIESAPVGILAVDAELRVNHWNLRMEALTRIAAATAVDQPLARLLPWLGLEALLAEGQLECVLQSPAQQALRVHISPFQDPSGGYVVILDDISEKVRMEEQLLQASKLASLGRLTAGISHEVGNPIAVISSLVQELVSLEDRPDASFTRASLRTIMVHLERVARIVRSLGDFARTSTETRTPTDLAELLHRTVELVRFDRRFRTIRFSCEAETLPPLAINADQMEQVFLNLLLNALDALPEGGELRVAIRRSAREALVTFRDNGPGIDPAALDRIFDPFFTTKPLGKGTGLGLSICYGIVKGHGGTITVKSARGAGAAFTVHLPL